MLINIHESNGLMYHAVKDGNSKKAQTQGEKKRKRRHGKQMAWLEKGKEKLEA